MLNIEKKEKLTSIQKFYKDWKWTILLISICIAGIPLTTIFGIQSVGWGNDFWPNALSEFLGMFVDLIFGALFTFIVIDKYTQYHKNKQWGKIKNITYKNLYFILSNILLKLNLSLPKEMRVESYVLTEDIETLNEYLPRADFDIFIKSLSEDIGKVAQDNFPNPPPSPKDAASFLDEQLYSSLVKFKQHSKQDVVALSGLIIPKLLNFSDDIILLDDLIEFEEILTSLMANIKTVHRSSANSHNRIKHVWLLKLQEILNKIGDIGHFIEEDINIE